jgi:hypothetical protein
VEEEVPPKFRGRFSKSEKGIDTEICCDALKLASASRMERLILLSNDSDFLPLCRTLKEFGANISIMHLSAATDPNSDLLREADSYDVLSSAELDQIFVVATPAQPGEEDSESEEVAIGPLPEEAASEKPAAAPSDLGLASDAEPEPEGEGQ